MLSKFANKAICALLFVLISLGSKSQQLTTEFSATPQNGCAPLVVNFTDQSSGSPNQWKWDLGNGTISYLKNPSVTYLTPGKYAVKLVVRNAANNADSLTKTDFITVYAKPTVQFSSPGTSGCYPLDVQFNDQSIAGSDSIASWNWDFGDGISSSLKNPTHTYTSGGNFNVTLQITNSSGCVSTLSKTAYIQISSGALADFNITNNNSCGVPAVIEFQNLSTGTGALEYEWTFGDGNTSTEKNPSHTYATRGSYDVQLIVKNSSGCSDTLLKKHAITVGTVHADFTADDSVCAKTNVIFKSISSPEPGSVTWYFNDTTITPDLTVEKAFAEPGLYKVKMVANFGACMDSVTKDIYVRKVPVVKFSADKTTDCKIPLKVNFINETVDAASYSWVLGIDATTSPEVNPSISYPEFKAYNVTLYATSAEGCVSSLRKRNYITIQRPQITLKNLPDSSCVPFAKTFADTITVADNITTRVWDFGDGTTASGVNPVHNYNAAGIYDVKLIVTTAGGCIDSAKVKNAVIVTTKPVIKFSASPLNACAKTEIQFTDETTGGATKWLWRFGDGSTSILQNPKHKYKDTGYYDIQLIVWNRGCPDSVKYTKYIHIDPPIARFKVSFDCKKPFERVFTDNSVGADEWHWDFGDGNTSTQRSPVHTYSTAGTYVASLTVINYRTGCDFTAVQQIDVVYAKAAFIADDTVVCRGTQVNFTTGLSRSVISYFYWTFGDETTPNPAITENFTNHTYTKNGVYSARLAITDILGCKDTLVKNNYISVGGPVAKFTSVNGSCLNTTVTFTDSSKSDGIHPISNWAWEYGDGAREVLTNAPFSHNYTNAGVYTVKLKVEDSAGCSDSTLISTPLEISQPKADFASPDTLTCPGKPVKFTNQSSGPGLTYNWSFGDGSHSTDAAPSHSYAANGIFSVKLVITDQYGCSDSITKANYVKVLSAAANFLINDSFTTCPPLLVQFTDKSSNAVSLNWDFGDSTSSTAANPSHFYVYPGNYIAKLTVTGPGGCTTEMQKTIVIHGPTGSFTYQPVHGCNPVTVNFSATSNSKVSYIWDFNDGTTVTTTDSVVSHTYTNNGTYRPKLILVNANGCQVPLRGRDTIFVSGVKPNFVFENKNLCDSGIINFTDSSISNDAIVKHEWIFGDNATSDLQNPSHIYTVPGTYYPTLVVTTQYGCTDSFTTATPVRVVASPKVSLLTTGNGCTPLTVRFNGSLAVPDTSALQWDWTFGNGNTANVKNVPAQIYTTAGSYSINLVVTNSSGCKGSASATVEAFPIPAVNAGNDAMLCNGSSITLNASGANTYSWSPATGLNCTDCAGPTTSTVSDITYTVTGTSANGCTAVDSVRITVKNPFTLTHSLPTAVCKGDSKKITAAGANTYEWTPSRGLDNPVSAEPTAKPDTTTNYRVVGTDELGCFRDTGYVLVTVNPIPAVEAGTDKTINAGGAVDLMPTISPDVTGVYWTPTNGQFRNIYPGVTVKPVENTEYTVEVENTNGCRARDKVMVFVICNNGNVFIPNTFSPNNDGVNDIFYPRGTGLFMIKSLKVYNRWGEMVFAKNDFNANDPSSGWDGTYKGVKLNPDVFVYTIDIICSNKSILTFKGNIALIQ
ncbi:MAG: PKD domain-containing protein [Ferruginibacter sp.]